MKIEFEESDVKAAYWFLFGAPVGAGITAATEYTYLDLMWVALVAISVYAFYLVGDVIIYEYKIRKQKRDGGSE